MSEAKTQGELERELEEVKAAIAHLPEQPFKYVVPGPLGMTIWLFLIGVAAFGPAVVAYLLVAGHLDWFGPLGGWGRAAVVAAGFAGGLGGGAITMMVFGALANMQRSMVEFWLFEKTELKDRERTIERQLAPVGEGTVDDELVHATPESERPIADVGAMTGRSVGGVAGLDDLGYSRGTSTTNEGTIMAVKHTPPSGPSEVHKGKKGGKTGCGIDTTKNPSHWVSVPAGTKITCARNGCKN